MQDPVFGPVISAGEIERALFDTLRARTPTYLHWIEDQTGRARGTLRTIAWWRTAGRLVHDGDEPLPVCIIVSPGLTGAPERRRPKGSYRAVWDLRASVLVGSTGKQDQTRDIATLYGAAVRAAVVQDRTLGGRVTAARWIGETYDDLDPDEDRTLGITVVRFAVDVDDVISDQHGPTELDDGEPPPRPPPPLLDTPEITVTPVPLTQETA